MAVQVKTVLLDIDEEEKELPVDELESALRALVSSPLSHHVCVSRLSEPVPLTRWQRFIGVTDRRMLDLTLMTVQQSTATLVFGDEDSSEYVAGPTKESVEMHSAVRRGQLFSPLPVFDAHDAIAGVLEYVRTGVRPARFFYHFTK